MNVTIGLKHSLVDREGKTPAEMRKEAFTLLTDATRAAVKDLSVGLKGYRRGGVVRSIVRPVSITRLTVKDIGEYGHPHLHGLWFVKSEDTGGYPFSEEYLVERLNFHVGKMAGRNRDSYCGVNQIVSVHSEPTEDVEATLRYFLLANGRHWKDGAWRFPPGTRRITGSPGLTPARRKKTVSNLGET